ncbi:ATP-binding cassette domain-containing protein [Bradyrhizobium sp. LB14.3]|uniref:ATP-binding cassette domain-containing protein n=1 Tax=Bradyrhizobium sp. LB14.3 TaxID=3156328 RepID=UPI003397C89D
MGSRRWHEWRWRSTSRRRGRSVSRGTTLTDRERRTRRRAVSVIYQDPLSSFDPRRTVGRTISDRLANDVLTRGERDARVVQLLDLVGLSSAFLDRQPLELSGGQRQRVAIARAIAPRPAVIVCDEPVSALDFLIQAQVLDLLADLKAHLKMSYIFISHDLGLVRHLSDRVIVMREGASSRPAPGTRYSSIRVPTTPEA